MADQQQIFQLVPQVEWAEPDRQKVSQTLVQVETSDTRDLSTGMYNYAILSEDGGRLCTEDSIFLITEQESDHRSMLGGGVGGGSSQIRSITVRPFTGGGVGGGGGFVATDVPISPRFTDWLVQRLTAVKKKAGRWVELAKSIQTFWETEFDPALKSLEGLRSIYSADPAGKRLIVAELGGYFEPDLSEFVQPTAVAMRRMEVAQKDTAYPILAAIQRMGLSELETPVEWCPLYALESDGPYGTKFYHKHTGIPDGAYMTSRGVLMVDIVEVDQDTLDRLDAIVRKVKPLHIVYDGVILASIDYSIPMTLITEDRNPIIGEDLEQLTT